MYGAEHSGRFAIQRFLYFLDQRRKMEKWPSAAFGSLSTKRGYEGLRV